MVCYNTPMPEKYESGQEISFDGGTWGMIEEVKGDTIWVTDEDGGDHELTDSRIDAIIPSAPAPAPAPVSPCSPAWEYRKTWRG